MVRLSSCAVPLLLLASIGDAATIAQLRDQRRILLVSAPSPSDPRLTEQRHILDRWRQGAADRDITMVELVTTHVSGSDDSAAALHARYALPPDHFEAVPIGKDGHVSMRSPTPLSAAKLEATIDGMPMRRAGER